MWEKLKTVELAGRSGFLLFVRLYWGLQFIQAGLGKIKNIDNPISYFASLNIPFHELTAYVVAGSEFVAGGLLVLGLLTRPAAAQLTLIMLGAYYFADFDALKSIYADPSAFVKATPFSFLFASLVALLFGAGAVSLDAAIERWRRPKGTA